MDSAPTDIVPYCERCRRSFLPPWQGAWDREQAIAAWDRPAAPVRLLCDDCFHELQRERLRGVG